MGWGVVLMGYNIKAAPCTSTGWRPWLRDQCSVNTWHPQRDKVRALTTWAGAWGSRSAVSVSHHLLMLHIHGINGYDAFTY